MSSTTGQLRNQRHIPGITIEKAEAALARTSCTKTNTNGAAAAVRVRMCTSEADFHKRGIEGGSARVWATACDVFCRTPSRVGRGRRAAVDFDVCFGWGAYFSFFFSIFFFVFLRTHTARCKYEAASRHIYLSTSTGVRTGCHCLISLSVCVCVCVTLKFVVFTYCESCTRPISTNPVSMEAGEYGLTRGTWFFARRLEVVKVAGLLWLSRCVFGEAGFFHFRP